jgi:hypothetical protein
MVKNVLTHVGGVENFGIISMCLFFAVFLGAIVWAATMKKSTLHSASRLPLEDGSKNDGGPHE